MTFGPTYAANSKRAPLETASKKGFDAGSLNDGFQAAFNSRDWRRLRTMLADDVVFHRATGDTVFIGVDAVMSRFAKTVGHPEQWNVKFTRLEADSVVDGVDGRVVTRGDITLTAGADDRERYRGSYLMTWTRTGREWRVQAFAWQDVAAAREPAPA